MAGTLQFDLVSPERKLASVEAIQVQIPGMEGDFAAMPDHAPFLTTLRPGIIRVITGSETTEYVVTGGFAEVSPKAASVLAEIAVPRDEVDLALVEKLVEDSEQSLTDAPEAERRQAAQRLRDARTLKETLGL